MTPLLALLCAYLIGGIPFGYILVRLKTGKDVRAMGSGNIGATNVLRTAGRGAGSVVLLLDILKGWLAVFLAAWLTGGDILWTSMAALAVIVGHAYPVFLRFQGGKAVASFVGAFLYLAPLALLSVLALFVLVVWRTRYISLGSILAAGTFPLGVWLVYHPDWPLLLASVLAGVLIIARHWSNIERLRAGNENVFRFGGSRK
jgi:acyl phosphate:glycerol-3-phosphate acyltransferase